MRDELSGFFESFDSQAHVDNLCALYNQLEDHLARPVASLQLGTLPSEYLVNHNDCQYFNITKLFRIIYSLQYFRGLIQRLDEFFVSVEYFQGAIEFKRTSNPISEEYSIRFFLNVCSDSLKASLDIYAKVVGWFFDMKHKKEMGFSYAKFVKPLRATNPALSQSINNLLQSDHYDNVVHQRNTQKHIGHQNFSMSIEEIGNSFKITASRTTPFDHRGTALQVSELYAQLKLLIEITVNTMKDYDLGYDSPEDRIVRIEHDQSLRDLGKLKNLSFLRHIIG